MNILFLTIGRFKSIDEHSLYPDLLRCFKDNGHNVYIVSRNERRENIPTSLNKDLGVHILSVKTGNITECGMIEKGISTLKIESDYKKAIKKYFNNVKFDLVLYSTPPITLAGVVEYVKKRDNAKTYLLLKDIFPQNAVDLGMMSKTGLKSPIYKLFRKKEKKLYSLSDRIGCMSPANVQYILNHNSEIPNDKVEVCPNCIEPADMSVTEKEKNALRQKYGIPQDKTVFVYGGNLGRPQGIPFLIKCLKSQKDNSDAFFFIVGSGTEYSKLEDFVKSEKQKNVKLMPSLPKTEYDKMIASCDVGMIFLDHRFTIPNFPSRLLAYMQAKLPVLAVTDPNTDIGRIIEENGFGWWCESNNVEIFAEKIQEILNKKLQFEKLKNKEYLFLKENYCVEKAYNLIKDWEEK